MRANRRDPSRSTNPARSPKNTTAGSPAARPLSGAVIRSPPEAEPAWHRLPSPPRERARGEGEPPRSFPLHEPGAIPEEHHRRIASGSSTFRRGHLFFRRGRIRLAPTPPLPLGRGQGVRANRRDPSRITNPARSPKNTPRRIASGSSTIAALHGHQAPGFKPRRTTPRPFAVGAADELRTWMGKPGVHAVGDVTPAYDPPPGHAGSPPGAGQTRAVQPDVNDRTRPAASASPAAPRPARSRCA